MDPLEILELLYQAVNTESGLGIEVRVSDFRLAAARCYKVRAEAADPALDKLQFRRGPLDPEHTLWIVKGGKVEPGAKPPEPEPGPGAGPEEKPDA